MEKINQKKPIVSLRILFSFWTLFLLATALHAQEDSTATAGDAPAVKSYTKNTFDGNYIIDNRTVMVNIPKTLEFDILHHFGTINNGTKDLFGIFSSANMRLGFSYVVFKNLEIGFGASNYNMTIDGSLKYAILKQTTDNKMPVSITYFGDMAMDTRARTAFLPLVHTTDRFSYFHQLLIARKFNSSFSLQVGADLTYLNNVMGYYDEAGAVQPQYKHAQFAFTASGRYKISPATSSTAIIVNYEQPVTQNDKDNPYADLSFGLETRTSGHDFQIFAGTYSYTLPQYNRVSNDNNFKKWNFMIGFTMSRLWNF